LATIKIQGDQVQIDDIATEKTLQALVKSLGGSTGSFKKNLDNTSSSLSGLGKGFDLAAGATKGTVKSLTDLGKGIFQGTAKLSTATDTFAANFGDVGKVLAGNAGGIIKTGEGLVNSFKYLSQSGASFAGDIFEMKNSAAQSRMSLDQFADIVTNNSEKFAAMGGNVSDGARAFTNFSKNFYESGNGLAQQMMNLGMGTEEIGEQLAMVAAMESRRNLQNGQVQMQAMQAAASMAKEMDAVAKLTGKNKKELQEAAEASKRKGQVEAKFRKIELEQGEEAAARARQAYDEQMKLVSVMGPEIAARAEEAFIFDGAVKSQMARNGQLALGDAGHVLVDNFAQIGKITENQVIDSAAANTKLQAAVTKRIESRELANQAMMAAAENRAGQAAANLLAAYGHASTATKKYATSQEIATGDYTKAAEKQRAAIKKEQEGRKTDKKGNEFKTAGTAATEAIMNAELGLKNLSAVVNNDVLGPGKGLNLFKDELESAADFLKNMTSDDVRALGSDLVTPLIDLLTGRGEPVPGQAEMVLSKEQAQGAKDIINAIQDMTIEVGSEQEKSAIAILDMLKHAEHSGKLVDDLTKQAGGAENLGPYIQELIKEKDFDGSMFAEDIVDILAKSSGVSAKILSDSLTGNNVKEGVESALSAMDMVTIQADTVNVNSEGVSRAEGSLGAVGSLIEDFGKGTPATLHGKEGIITSEQLENMAKGVSGMMQSVQPQSNAANNNMNTAGLEKAIQQLSAKIDQLASKQTQSNGGDIAETLNNSLKELTNMSAKQFDVARKQLKSTKGLSGNVFGGF